MAEQSGLDDEIHVFLDNFKLKEYDDALRKSGLENLEIIHQLEDDDINEIINDTNMKENDIETFKNAINLVKNGNYNPNKQQEEFKYEYKTIESDGKVNDKENNKTIIFIGESGVGKTTLINSLCNYLFNVKYNNKFRYKLIYENENKNDATQSQTQEITPYYLNSKDLSKIDYSLTIIDTPGFGNTNIENDTIIKSKFKQCFNTIEFIDAIYFVIKATDGTRLSDLQKYIFNSIYKLFNDNIKENIYILFTFSDGNDPPALKSIHKTDIKYQSWFQINNSGFEPPKQQSDTHKMFFDLGLKQFDQIFESLSKVQRQSVKELTENVPIVKVHKGSQNEYDNIENVDRGNNAGNNNSCCCGNACQNNPFGCSTCTLVKVAIGCVVVAALVCVFGIKYGR